MRKEKKGQQLIPASQGCGYELGIVAVAILVVFKLGACAVVIGMSVVILIVTAIFELSRTADDEEEGGPD